jgi:cytochrome c-type biogenesis protein CcmH
MNAVPALVFVLLALAATGFAAVPLWRHAQKKGRAVLLAAVAVFVLGIGGGAYWMLGRPYLAQRSAQGLNTHDINGLVPYLVARVHKTPNDAQAWRYLGRVYMAANDARDAAKAYGRALQLVGSGDAALDADYGVALAVAARGTVPDDAVAAFTAALAADPKNAAARLYLGLAKVQHGDRAGAIPLWQSLLADTPTATPLHQILVDRLAILTSQGGGAPAGGPRAMVAMLAERLKADPNDALGWVRLIHAYHVLGEETQARGALASARKAFAANKDAQTAFDTEAKELK